MVLAFWNRCVSYQGVVGTTWDDLKSDLLEIFARRTPYTCSDKVRLLKSLTKGGAETYQTFLLRVQWVLRTLGNDLTDIDHWTKLIFLAGLSEHEFGGIIDVQVHI